MRYQKKCIRTQTDFGTLISLDLLKLKVLNSDFA